MKNKLIFLLLCCIGSIPNVLADGTNPRYKYKLSPNLKYVDQNNDDIITLDEASLLFELYFAHQSRILTNELIIDVESTVIDVISYLEGINCDNIKKTVAVERFIEVYYANKFVNTKDIEFGHILAVDTTIIAINTTTESPLEPDVLHPSFFDKYFSVGAQIISLYQTVINPTTKKIEAVTGQPNTWPSETMVIFDLPIDFTPWKNGTFNITPEYTGGNAIGGAVGMGSYVNGIYGAATPTPILLRAQFSQLFENKKAKSNFKSVEFTIGKMYFLDQFDYNAYSGDSYVDFLNYNHIMPAAWDAATTVFGLTYGGGMKLNYKNSQLNFALVTVNKEPAGKEVDWNVKNAHSFNMQYVKRFTLGTKTGSIRTLGFYNRVLSGKYTQAVSDSSGYLLYFPDSLRKYQVKMGFAFDADLALNEQLGLFTRYSWNNGKTEAMHYTEADQSINVGAVYNFSKFNRPNDEIGIAVSMNSISNEHRTFIENGGSGFMLLNGISNYKQECAFEIYYDVNLFKYTTIGINYQYILNPGYNKDNASTNFLACRLNFTFK